MGLGLLFQTLGSPCQSSRSISQESRCNPEAQLCAATAAAPNITARGGISSALASWNLGKTSYVERITEIQSYNKPRHGRLGGTAAIHWMLQCRGGPWKSTVQDTGQASHADGHLPLANPRSLRLSSQGTGFIKHWCLGAGISSSTWAPYCGHRNTGTRCTSAERSRSSARGFLPVESSTVWPSRFKSLFNPSLSCNLSFWDSIVSGPNWEAIHCFSYLKNPIPRLHTSEMGICSWRLLNFFKI